jgi:hypothetical protein
MAATGFCPQRYTGRPSVPEVAFSRSIGKLDDAELNEDLVLAIQHFYAVIDGATAKSSYAGTSPGRRAAEAVATVIRRLPPDVAAREAIDSLSAALAALALLEPGAESPTASLLMLSVDRDEIWVVGDGWISVEGRPRRFGHEIERRGAAARAALLRAELTRASVVDLLAEDPGRAMILPLLQRESLLSNLDGDDDLAFGRLDGRRVPDRFLHVIPLPAGWSRIVLASDGYPELLPSLEQSERALAERIARDPLMIADPPTTKGVGPGRISYDDRSWLEIVR